MVVAQPAEAPKRTNRWAIVLIAVLVALVLAGILAWLLLAR
jgi:hypothetical protein